MAINDIFRIEFATEYDGGAAVTSLHYKQVIAIAGEPDTVPQVLMDSLFIGAFAPYQLIQGEMGSGLKISAGRVQKLRPTPDLQQSVSANYVGTSPNPSMPITTAMTISWHSNDVPGDLVSNRIFVPGFTLAAIGGAGFTQTWTSLVLDFFCPALRSLNPDNTGVAFTLQQRTNTGGPEEEVAYTNASVPFLRTFPTRIGSRSTRVI